MLRHTGVAFFEFSGDKKHARAESLGEGSVKNNENQCVPPALPWVTYGLHHHQEGIVQCTPARIAHCQITITRCVAGGSEGDKEPQRPPESEKNKDEWNEDEFVVQVDHCSCYFPLHVEAAVGNALHHWSWSVLQREGANYLY